MTGVAQHDLDTMAPPPPASACHSPISPYVAFPLTGDIAPRRRDTGRHRQAERPAPDDGHLLLRGILFGIPLSALLWIVIIVIVRHLV